MKKVVFLFLLISIIAGCSLNLKDIRYLKKSDNIQPVISNEPTKIDTLNEVINFQETYIDSLSDIISGLNYKIDSLNIQLQYSQKRVAVNTQFVIPDSIFFAGRKFDLSQERIRHKFIEIYKNELKWAHIYIPRSGKYFPLFEKKFEKNNIPLDTKYLAIAESGLNSLAGSKVGARGIWQFMPKTAKGYGMHINDFIDERLHPVKATDAACKYILNAKTYLKNRDVNDWLLILASYNAGVGSISKVVRKQKSNDFFGLVLQVDETNKYVWRAVAIKMIFDNEEKIFGKKFKREDPFDDLYKEVSLELKGHYKVDEWVSAQGSSIGKIWEINPWIKLYKRRRKKYSAINDIVLPPGKYEIIFPRDAKPNSERVAFFAGEYKKKNSGYFQYHVVKKGESLWKIASKYKTTITKIKQLNNLSSNVIRPGQKLRLRGQAPRKTKYYTVKGGDTLWEIAKNNKLSIKSLMKLNSLKSSSIRPGQKLILN